VASYMMWGMNYTDMAYLKKEHIVSGRVHYRRSKTSKLYDIKITPALNEILEYYIKSDPGSEYVFPILKRDAAEFQYRDIKWSRKRYNTNLKDLAVECKIEEGIPVNMSSNVIRHTFATHAVLLDIPLLAISTMLGHSSVKTTQIYIKELPTNKLDDYNDRIMNGSIKKPKRKKSLQALE
jgi:integrase/recombinase XerD